MSAADAEVATRCARPDGTATRRPTTRAESLYRLESEIGVLLRRIKRVAVQRSKAVHPDLQPGGYMMLIWIADHGPVRASALAEEFDIDKGAVSRTVQHLGDLGLLDREPDPADGRAVLVSASAEARHRLDAVEEQRRVWFKERLRGWTVAELTTLAEDLGRYNQALDVCE
ncbi:MAG: MarR family transcriptional regulator [Nocardioides sp.]|uniref:MarR family winged helix-turn-helix transcriptional regulator n=1 Tax=Nocardioides sp. TaxID=35761 RepID=UPI0039E3BE73